MAISRLVYVTCDHCGRPAGDEQDLADTAPQAHRVAKRLGWIRVSGRDLCPDCQEKS